VTICDGRDDVCDSGGGLKKTVTIVTHRHGVYPSNESSEEIMGP